MNQKDTKSKADPPKKVAIYLRVSTDEQTEMHGEKLQLDAVKNLIESRDKDYIENRLTFAGDEYVYYDDGISGTKDITERPQLQKLMEDYDRAPKDNKPFDAVAVYKIDRLARRLKVLIDVIDFFESDERGIKLLSVHENIDTSTPFGRAMLNIMGVIAELEVETIKERMMSGRIQAIENGGIMGRGTVLGYVKKDKVLTVKKIEADLVKRIFNLFVVQNKTPIEISTILKNDKVLTSSGWNYKHKKSKGSYTQSNKPYHWTDGMVRRVLEESLYIGKYYYGKKSKGKAVPKEDWLLSGFKYPKIIDKVTFERTQARMSVLARSKNTKRKDAHIYPLAGLLTCDSCKDFNDHRMHWGGVPKKIKSTGKMTYAYKCGRKASGRYSTTCSVLPIPATEIEEYIIKYTKKLLNSPIPVLKYQKQLNSSKVEIKFIEESMERARKRLNAIPKQIEQIKYQNEYGLVGNIQMKQKILKLDKEEVVLKQEYKNLNYDLSKNNLSNEYEEPLKLFAKKYKSKLDSKFNNPAETKEILGLLFEEIIVYSRPVTKDDVIAGRKKKEQIQMMPNKIHMRMRLPQDILEKVITEADIKEKSADCSADGSRRKNVSSGC